MRKGTLKALNSIHYARSQGKTKNKKEGEVLTNRFIVNISDSIRTLGKRVEKWFFVDELRVCHFARLITASLTEDGNEPSGLMEKQKVPSGCGSRLFRM